MSIEMQPSSETGLRGFSVEKPPTVFQRVKTGASRLAGAFWQRVKPGPSAIRGAGWGMLIVASLIYLAFIVAMVQGPMVSGLISFVVLAALGALLAFAEQIGRAHV